MDISTSLAAVLKTHPQMAPKEALWTVRNKMLANNPYQPPSDGKCPINELPAEILGYIFKVGVEMEDEEDEDDGDEDDWEDMSDDEDEYNDDDDDDNDIDYVSTGSAGSSTSSTISSVGGKGPLFQVLASHVCQHWREVALNLHDLWTRLNFEDTLQLDKTKAFIDRSQGLPLKIFIDCALREDVDEEDHPDHPLYDQNKKTLKQVEDDASEKERFFSQNDLMQILDLIEPEVSHWGEFDFHVSTYGYVQFLLARLHKLPSAPLLKKFHVYHHEDCEDYEFFNGDDKTSYLPFHGNAPLLESAIFWGVHIDWDKSLPFLQGLREFELSYHTKDVRPSYATFIQIIKNSPDLRSLSLSLSSPALDTGAQFDDKDQWGPEPFEIPSVHHLTLQFHEPQYASALIQHFYFPNLRSLTLNFDQEDYSSFVRKLLVPVQGQSKSILSGLESLRILGLPCDVATVEAMLQQLTDLKALDLKCFGSEERVIFRKLIDPSAGRKKRGETKIDAQPLPKIFCPALETLTVSLVSGHRVKTLVMARKIAGVPLKTLRLSYDDGITVKTAEWLRQNTEVLEFFEPSDSEDEVEVDLDENGGDDDDDDDDDDDESDESDEEDEDEESEGEDDDLTLGPDGAPLLSPVAQHLSRRIGRGRSDLD
ncbi:hypothetical protein BYT27DRAFT_7204821 [Phlegmacium glaucopus]|nr:hypothetical protein BYT27DRAFT_7204821 [Phlegmacium glaucopus]